MISSKDHPVSYRNADNYPDKSRRESFDLKKIFSTTFSQLGPAVRALGALLSRSDEDDPQIVIVQSIGIEHTDGFIRFTLCTHRHKGEASRLIGLAVLDDIDGCDLPSS